MAATDTHPDTVFMYGERGGDSEANRPHPFHDGRCACPRHCLNCYADLQGHGHDDPTSKRTRYCGDYCKGRMKRERALDRAMGLA